MRINDTEELDQLDQLDPADVEHALNLGGVDYQKIAVIDAYHVIVVVDGDDEYLRNECRADVIDCLSDGSDDAFATEEDEDSSSLVHVWR